jgi:cytochrome c biogenesis protein CcmG/thiol:disulfide interchange protein DsbE
MPPRLPLIALLLGVLALVIVVGVATKQSSPPPRPAPALPTQTLHPPTVALATVKGHPVLVNFWASWCHPCQKEAPELARFASHRPGVQLVGVDTGDNATAARTFIRRYRWDFPVLRDADNSVGDHYGIAGLPTTFVLDAQGRIVNRLVGPQTQASLDRAIKEAT